MAERRDHRHGNLLLGGIGLWLGLAGLHLGCSDPGNAELKPSTNSNTSWIQSCFESAECPLGFDCNCGYCTAPCQSDGDCQLGAPAICAPVSHLSNAGHCAGLASGGLCVPPCQSHADCMAPLRCVVGVCSPPVTADLCPDAASPLLCLGFEDAIAAHLEEPLAGRLETATSAPYSGRAALAAHTLRVEERSQFMVGFHPLDSGTIYLRVWLQVPPDAALNGVHVLSLGDWDNWDWGVDFQFLAGSLQISGVPAGATLQPVGIPKGQWFCLRSRIFVSDTAGEIDAWVNDVLAVSARGIDTRPTHGIRHIAMGVNYQAQFEPATVLLDNLIISESPVSCVD